MKTFKVDKLSEDGADATKNENDNDVCACDMRDRFFSFNGNILYYPDFSTFTIFFFWLLLIFHLY